MRRRGVWGGEEGQFVDHGSEALGAILAFVDPPEGMVTGIGATERVGHDIIWTSRGMIEY